MSYAAASAADASRARAPLSGPAAPPSPTAEGQRRRSVIVHFTPFAHGCASYAVDAEKRNRVRFGLTPAIAVRGLCRKLKLEPADLTAVETSVEVEIIGRDKQGRHPHAMIWDGLTAAEINAELAALRAAGWSPFQPD